jgi:hypothetical protein
MGYPGWCNPRNPAPSHVVQEDVRATRQRARKANPEVQQKSPQRQGRSDKAVQVDTEVSVSDPSSFEESSLADSDLDSSVSFGTREESPEPGSDSSSSDEFPPGK